MKAASSTSSNALDVVKNLVTAGADIALKNGVGRDGSLGLHIAL